METGYPRRNTILCAEYDINTGGSAKLDKLLQKVTIQSYYYVYIKSNIGWSFPGNSGWHKINASPRLEDKRIKRDKVLFKIKNASALQY